ncbi:MULTISPECIES: YrhK family protein [unclassified Streptomyces]|uniref:YrhK family protein n=1 Tax=unclassified Streptomyces TaxID=2593676 RepID=UPI002DDBCA24|nr:MULTISPECIES: YrhK family protein [unclassified Streptomyces]WSA91469.1 YrhK family protein [Streptomyces sp. NBC_01795]WSB75841.1 YrhK family protein [Streptomyces sp. NBC_01775]WSS15884.1 YrhK family protein [Streptomyces sp. NBC_01186]WSS44724.1 YrhK family protein [Streptomyces sp. NBC_01187]
MSETPPPGGQDRRLTLRIGKDELIVSQRYEAVSIINDILIGVWFLAGSVMFFAPDWTRTGTWCFVFGSVELLVRPVIRFFRQFHLQSLRGVTPVATASDQDY